MKKNLVIVLLAFAMSIQSADVMAGKGKQKEMTPIDQLFLIAKKRVVIEDGKEKKLKTVEEIKAAIQRLDVDIDAKTKKKGNTALHMAVNHKRGKVVQALMKLSADMNIKNKAGKTPLEKVEQHLKNFSNMNDLFNSSKNFSNYFDQYGDEDEE